MTIEANKALVRRFIDEIFVGMSAEAVDELVTDDFTPHTGATAGPGKEPLRQAIERVSAGLADVSMSIEDIVAEGDRVAVRLISRATQVGPFMGLPPSGKAYSIEELHLFRIRDGKIAEHWHQADFLGLLAHLGITLGHH
jgi:steroid delta-isomerase-like uncharacterized protein